KGPLVQDVSAGERGQRDRGSGNEIERAVLVRLARLEEPLRELRELAGPEHGLRAHEMRQPELRVSVLARVQVEHELSERALEVRQRPPEDGEARLGDLGRALD